MTTFPTVRPSRFQHFLQGWRGEMGQNQLAFLLNVPTAFVVLLIIAYPIGYAVYLSLHEVTISGLRSGDVPFAGLRNYATILSDQLFMTTLLRTVIFGIVAVVSMMAVGLFVAMAMNWKTTRLSMVTKALVLLPWAIPPVGNGLMWSFIFNSNYGHFNALLYSLGLVEDFIPILSDDLLAVLAVLVAYVWRVFPFAALLFHAALQGIPAELYEAAEVDGASVWQRFWTITFPLLRPVMAVLLILRTAFALTIFEEVFALTQGGPGTATWTAAWYSYNLTFSQIKFDTGAASAFVLTLVIAAFAVIYFRFVYTTDVQ